MIPSVWYENSPLVLLYALAAHTPVIVSDVPGLTQFVQDGKDGFVFQRGDADSLSAVLNRIIEKPESALGMSVNTRYDRTTLDMTQSVIQLYESVLHQR